MHFSIEIAARLTAIKESWSAPSNDFTKAIELKPDYAEAITIVEKCGYI